MAILETALRGGAVALLLLLATVTVRDRWRLPAGRYGALFAVSGAAWVVAAPVMAGFHPRPLWVLPLHLLGIGTPALFWLWTQAHFDDDFVASRRREALWPALMALGAVALALDRRLAWRAVDLATVSFVAAGLWRTLAGMESDLVEHRRRLRAVLAIGTGLYILATTLSAAVAGGGAATAPIRVLSALGVAVIAFAFAVLAVSRPAAAAAAVPSEDTRAPTPAPAPPADAQEAATLVALRALMVDEKAYREEGINIAALALRLGLPEYRLRRLINRHLGHRNFSSFVNGYRIAEAMAALADPAQAAVPILTIALDAGFQSLGPFNRAFKARTATTPSEFRRRHLGRGEKSAAE